MNKQAFVYIAIIIVLFISVILTLGIGNSSISYVDLMTCIIEGCASPLSQTVIWELRLPRILAAIVVGGALAMAGAILQNATRNPLADPYLFGITAGAGLGAAISGVLLPEDSLISLPIAAFLGALFSVFLVLTLGRRLRRVEHLLLAGVAVAFMLGAATQIILYFGNPFASNRVMFWMMGSLARADLSHLYIIVPIVIFVSLLIIGFSRHIDALLLGDESAFTLGVNPQRLRMALMIGCAAITASIVAFYGGIGFVGLMIPHLVRRWFAISTKPLIIMCLLVGGLFLLWVDVLARSLIVGHEIPIGIITSLAGSLFFLSILKNRTIS